MATVTPNFNWPVPTSTDLVKDGATAIEALGDSIDASLVDLKGGTTGQVLAKASGTDMDFSWVAQDDSNAIQNTIVDAKGDLIAASAADTPARLAVGNNGETILADSSTSTGLRYNPQNALVNPVINGGMDIWQRGTSFTYAGGVTYTADRWCQQSNTSNNRSVSRQTVSDSTNLPNIQYSARLQRTAGNTSTDFLAVGTSIETINSIPFAGKTVTLTFYARAGANYSAASSQMNVSLAWGTGTDQNYITTGFTGQTDPVYQQNTTLTTIWQRFAFTAAIGSTATEMAIRLSTNAFVGTAGANDWIEVTGVQIDLGTYTASTAPTFRRSGGTIQGELAACQRYFSKSYNQNVFADGVSTTEGTAQSFAATTSALFNATPFPVTMRTSPTVNVYAGAGGSGSGSVRNNSAGPVVTGISVVTISQTSFTNLNKTAGFVLGNGYGFEYTASAEL